MAETEFIDCADCAFCMKEDYGKVVILNCIKSGISSSGEHYVCSCYEYKEKEKCSEEISA